MQVLFGLGPGESASDAFERVVDRFTETGDDLTVAVFGDPGERERLAAHAHDRLADAEGTATVTVRELESDPGSRLVELAEREGFDRIVIPGGERSPLGKIQLDSVAEFVVLNATTSVTLIR